LGLMQPDTLWQVIFVLLVIGLVSWFVWTVLG
jgi:hypothetical protein